ncbi:MAG: hypothetical protein E7113_01695 [Bacteroidales bacterium]|nr:hypothetical protein [Bacteroidales bacterium]
MEYTDRYARLEDRSDIALLKDITYGNKEALKELTGRYLGIVSRTTFRILCDRIDSEQVTVQVFASVWHDVLDYDDRYTVEEWILRKTCLYSRIRIMRRRILRIFGVVNDVFVRVSPKAENEDDYVTKQAWQLHCRATTHMTPLQSMTYALCVLEGMAREKVATITGMTGFRIGVAKNRAEDKVRAELKDYGKTDYYDSYNDFLRKVADGMSDMDKLNKMIIFAV